MQDITIAIMAIALTAIAPMAIDIMEIVPKSRNSGNFDTYKKR